MPEGGEKVGFADTEAAVEIDTGFVVVLFGSSEELGEEATACGVVDAGAEVFEGFYGCGLRGLVGVWFVGIEGDFAEAL